MAKEAKAQKSLNPTIRIRAIPTFVDWEAFFGCTYGESQSHHTNQGNSDFIVNCDQRGGGHEESLNPTIRIRAIPTGSGRFASSGYGQESLNPTIRIRAIPTLAMAAATYFLHWSRLNPTIRIRAIPTESGALEDYLDSIARVSIPPYESGQFRHWRTAPACSKFLIVSIPPYESGQFRRQAL